MPSSDPRAAAADAPVLVTGGAGYIGSHVVWALRDAGWPVVVLDDLSSGRREALPANGVELVVGDVGDGRLVAGLLREHRIGAVMHFAASIVVPESVARPLAYYRNNTVNSLALIQACVDAGIRAFVFSSTAAVYGEPARVPVAEDAPTVPLNPYGRSKLISEQMLQDADAAHGLPYVVLRYFNVAGADPAGRTGLAKPGATHLIKLACETAVGARDHLLIFGEDYPTEDGTCVRDFIHVSDLADAHLAALRHLTGGGASLVLNCGYGRGFSVRQVVDAMGEVSGRPLRVRQAPRRPGDAAVVIADAQKIRRLFDWSPRRDDLHQILADALAFERRLRA